MVTFQNPLLSQNDVTVKAAIHHIDTLLNPSEDTPFKVDEDIAAIARNVFQKNFCNNRIVSGISLLFGTVGVLGLGCAAAITFSNLPLALCIAAISAVSIKIFLTIRNPEGYRLQEALNSKSCDEKISQLSLGANIYQSVWPCGGAKAGLFQITKGLARTLCQHFAEEGERRVLTYVLMLEKDHTKRTQLATQAISHSKNIETAQLLLNFGAKIDKDNDKTLFFCTLGNKLLLTKFFVEHGARIDAGIKDYKNWQIELDKRQREFRGNWTPSNSYGVSPKLHPCFNTPLENLTDPHFSGNRGSDPRFALEALCLNPSVYQNKKSADELYIALNENGARIRFENAERIFYQLAKLS